MAMKLEDLAQMGVFYDGNAITKITSVEADFDAQGNDLILLCESYAGETPGPGSATITVGFVVPLKGGATSNTEAPYQADMVARRFVTMQIGLGTASYIGRGKVRKVNISQNVNQSTAGTFTWRGDLRPFDSIGGSRGNAPDALPTVPGVGP